MTEDNKDGTVKLGETIFIGEVPLNYIKNEEGSYEIVINNEYKKSILKPGEIFFIGGKLPWRYIKNEEGELVMTIDKESKKWNKKSI